MPKKAYQAVGWGLGVQPEWRPPQATQAAAVEDADAMSAQPNIIVIKHDSIKVVKGSL